MFVASYNTTSNTFNIRGADQSAVNIPSKNGLITLPSLSATTANNTVLTGYRILTLPAAAGGTLLLNGSAVTIGQNLTTTQAGQLSFQPAAGYQGAPFFTYSGYDSNNQSGNPGFYLLPVSNVPAVAINPLDFSRQPNGEDWKAHANLLVRGTNISTSGFTSSVTGTNTNTFAIATNQALLVPSLVWQQNPQGVQPADSKSQVTFTFDRPVNNLSMAVLDIDRDLTLAGSFIDEVTFDGYTTDAATTPIALTATNFTLANAGVNQFIGNNTVQGIGTSNSDVNATTVLTFSSPVKKLTLTFRNAAPYVDANTARTHTIGLTSFIWSAQADVTTTLRAQASPVVAGAQGQFNATFTNNGVDGAAQGVVAQIQLPSGLANVVATNGGSYNSNTGLVTYPNTTSLDIGASLTSTITFTTPTSGTVTATSAISTTSDEGTNTAPNSASASINATPIVLSGTIFDDVNYGGGVGRNYTEANAAAVGFTSGAIRQAGAAVELYDANGNFVATTTTNASGLYSFNVPSAATYTVRVVNSTVNSVRTLNTGFTTANIQAVQTFVNGVTNRVGARPPKSRMQLLTPALKP
ncbi:SdrD B-like domain-containing protein [Hymenobacter sp. 5414T-23]|uniref:SdrD B-like domain-containing protein n=1 Tax=Hymenobacter sp. 5414T-23 TaxID=2932252 RepID=UPI001FD3644E|nr:SdrD B-like domain-containing protein [Hymenobacter sp. 5414T-23]UOQ80467.1 hypothetical protein MUN83_16830 [Hymenobacter sp. 5414T-23]